MKAPHMPHPLSKEQRCYVVTWGELPTGKAKGMFAAALTLHSVPRRIADQFCIMLAKQVHGEGSAGRLSRRMPLYEQADP